MTGTRRDEKIARLIADHGMAGYGLYWAVQEIIADQMEGSAPLCSVTYPVGVWAKMLSSHPPQVLKQLSWLVHAGLMELSCGLHADFMDTSCGVQEITMTNVKLLKYRDEYSKKSRHYPDRLRTKEGDTDTDTEGEQKEQEQIPSPTPTEKPVVAEGPIEPIPPVKTPKPKAPKVPKPKEPKHSTDPRHIACKEVIFAYYRARNDNADPEWDGREGAQLGMLLSANPELTAAELRKFLGNRYLSEVNHADRPSTWISIVARYRNGPVDRFNKPLTGGNRNGKFAGASTKQSRTEDALAAVLNENRNGSGSNGYSEERGMDEGVADFLFGTVIEGTR